jgi:hypothetical protein
MTQELHSLILISPGVLRTEAPPRTEFVLDWDLVTVALAGVVVMVVIVARRKRA